MAYLLLENGVFQEWTDLKGFQDGNLNEKQLDKTFGNTKKIRDKHYNKNLNLNGKRRRTAINQITEG